MAPDSVPPLDIQYSPGKAPEFFNHINPAWSFVSLCSVLRLVLPASAPRVRVVLQVVPLELNLVFYLVDKNLREEHPDQLQKHTRLSIRHTHACTFLSNVMTDICHLWYGQAHSDASQYEQVTVDPVHNFVYAAISVDVVSSF